MRMIPPSNTLVGHIYAAIQQHSDGEFDFHLKNIHKEPSNENGFHQFQDILDLISDSIMKQYKFTWPPVL